MILSTFAASAKKIMDSNSAMDTDHHTIGEETNSLAIELKELGRLSWPTAATQAYLKGLQWSPDGKKILTAVNGQGLKIIDLPEDLSRMKSNVNGKY